MTDKLPVSDLSVCIATAEWLDKIAKCEKSNERVKRYAMQRTPVDMNAIADANAQLELCEQLRRFVNAWASLNVKGGGSGAKDQANG